MVENVKWQVYAEIKKGKVKLFLGAYRLLSVRIKSQLSHMTFGHT